MLTVILYQIWLTCYYCDYSPFAVAVAFQSSQENHQTCHHLMQMKEVPAETCLHHYLVSRGLFVDTGLTQFQQQGVN